MLTLPPLPWALLFTRLTAALRSSVLLSPSKDTVSVAVMLTLPASPFPTVLALNRAPLVTDRELVVMLTLPPLPWAPDSTRLAAVLRFPVLLSPSKDTVSVAVTFILPASPFPTVLTLSSAPLVTDSEPVVMVMLPPLPTALGATRLIAALETPLLPTLSNETVSVAVMLMLPASPVAEVLTLRRKSG